MIKEGKLQKSSSENRLETIDGLRGLAIILVLWFHVWQQSWLPNGISIGDLKFTFDYIPAVGFIGVDLFFFISAFCLFYPYAKTTLEGTKEQMLKRFAYRRFIKIVPSYYLSLIIIVIAVGMTKFQSIFEGIWHILRHALFINCFFADTYHGSINPVFWSTAVEVQFYIIFPIICYFFRKKPFLTYLGMFLLGNIYRNYISAHYMSKLSLFINQLPGVIDIFAAGMLAAYIMVYLRSKIKDHEGLKPFLTFIAIVSLVVFFNILKWGYYSNGGNIQLWQLSTRHYLGWLFILLGVSLAFSAKLLKRVVANKLFIFASTISYNLYIWHQWLAVQIKERGLIKFVGNDPHQDFNWQLKYTAITIIASVCISTLITYGFEKPLLNNGFKGCARNTISTLKNIKNRLIKGKADKSTAA